MYAGHGIMPSSSTYASNLYGTSSTYSRSHGENVVSPSLSYDSCATLAHTRGPRTSASRPLLLSSSPSYTSTTKSYSAYSRPYQYSSYRDPLGYEHGKDYRSIRSASMDRSAILAGLQTSVPSSSYMSSPINSVRSLTNRFESLSGVDRLSSTEGYRRGSGAFASSDGFPLSSAKDRYAASNSGRHYAGLETEADLLNGYTESARPSTGLLNGGHKVRADVTASSLRNSLSSGSDVSNDDDARAESPLPALRRGDKSRQPYTPMSDMRRSIMRSSGGSDAAASSTSYADTPSRQNANNGLVGLKNLGNTCFMNSIIQCLSNTNSLRDYCLNESWSCDVNNNTSRMKGALMKAFVELLSELWDHSYGDSISPDRFKNQVQKFAPRFTGYNQQDAQEFLRYLLQGLHEDINRVRAKPKPLPPVADDLPEAQKAGECWKRYLSLDNSKIVDLFVGQLKSELRCTDCEHVSVTFDPFWDLSLPIPSRRTVGAVSLAECFDTFTKEEILDGDEMPTCEHCKARRRCTKQFSIYRFPAVLVIHLKRFSGDRYRSRLSTEVSFPVTNLDLSKYASPKSGFTPLYNLYAISNHSGTPMFGHYTAYCKHALTKRWYLYDDMRVLPVSNGEKSVVTSEAYVLFFELATSS